MKYKVIDNAVHSGMGDYLFNTLCEENIWNLNLKSSTEKIAENEPMLPGSLLMNNSVSLNVNMFVEGFLKSTFISMMYNNNLHFTKLTRILCNANYPKTVLDYHIDIEVDGYETIVLFITPNLEESNCGIMIGEEYVNYEFCRAVLFNSKTPHTAVSPQKEIPLPRLSIGFMYKV